MQALFLKFFYLKPKNSLGFLIGKHPLLHFFSKRWLSYVHLYRLASEALHIGRIGNITKPLRILYQLSKFFLNFGQGRKSVTTLPHLMQHLQKKKIWDFMCLFEKFRLVQDVGTHSWHFFYIKIVDFELPTFDHFSTC